MELEPTAAIPTGGEDNENTLQNIGDIPPGGDLPSVNPDTSDALDALLKEKQNPPTETPPPAPVVDPAAPPVTTPPPVVPEPTFETVEPPPNVKPKTVEAFTQIKALAKKAVTAAEKRALAAEARAKELEDASKAQKALTPETEKELEELRTFRKSLDVEADPQFKEFDTKVAENEAAILSRLKDAGASEELLAKVKEIGVADVDWDSLASKLPPSVRRVIDAKLVENENFKDAKKQAVAKAKANADEFFKTRTEAQTKQAEARLEQTKQNLDKYIPQMAWLATKPVPVDAKPEEKTALEAHNKLVAETKQDIAQALQDDSPEMRAILVLGYAQLKEARRDLTTVQATAAAEKKALEAKVTAAEERATKAEEFAKRIKGASTSRIQSSAPPTTAAPAKVDYRTDTGTALDTHLAELLAAKE